MNWLLASVLCVGLVEVGMRLPFVAVIDRLLRASRKAAAVVRSRRISDHWKERAMGAYARATFGATLMLALMIAGLLGSAFVFVELVQAAGAKGFFAFLAAPVGLIFTCVAACLYAWARMRLARGRAHGSL